ncbi:cation channel sperm-associated protein subunit gamma-like [Chanos chanos]|uniref:Cation channel sperm-associated protein subunit gamma-like n=1 Tax=Chanos chanos TaxID=29144 RepID=A0A6J2W0P7_CHACN|nr:cation channel sperm-associated protein subunit gamma [Chanos chanos]
MWSVEILLVLLFLSVETLERRCEWGARLCETGNPLNSTWVCNFGDPLTSPTGGMEIQELSHSVQAVMSTLDYQPVDTQQSSNKIYNKDTQMALMTGLTPEVTLIIQEPTHPVHLKPQRLHLVLTTAPSQDNVSCDSNFCQFGWYAPMPMLNGSVVYRVKVNSNGVGQEVPEKSFSINVNGFVQSNKTQKAEMSVGVEIPALEDMLSLETASRPLWAVYEHAPVLLLAGIPGFNAEAIATESSLFIRHNHLLYRFVGNYSLLALRVPPSDSWQPVLQSVCVSGMVPVFLPHHGTEYLYALGGGGQKDTLYRFEIYDGDLNYTELLDSKGRTACQFMNSTGCEVRWAAFNPVHSLTDIILVELEQREPESSYQLLILEQDFRLGDAFPSLDVGQTFLFFAGFPLDQMIKYFTMSFHGEFAFVTETEEVFSTLQTLRGHLSHSTANSLLTVYYDWDKQLQEVIYTVDTEGRGSVLKRKIPVPEILSRSHHSTHPHKVRQQDDVSFPTACPFILERLENLPHPEPFNRIQQYQATPPRMHPSSGLHSTQSLITYQGLMYRLLHMHSAYLQVDWYFYIGSNAFSSSGFSVEMEGYSRPSLSSELTLPDKVYLNYRDSLSFTIHITATGHQQLLQDSTDRKFLDVMVYREEQLHLRTVTFNVTVMDRGAYPGQALAGEGLIPLSVLLRGQHRLSVLIGCRPGSRLAYDAIGSVQESIRLNGQYLDCLNPDPSSPCFYFEDYYRPIILLQDMVSGRSERYLGSSQRTLIWIFEEVPETLTFTEQGFPVMTFNTSPISWFCQSNSPCGELVPHGLISPDFYFTAEVSSK